LTCRLLCIWKSLLTCIHRT